MRAHNEEICSIQFHCYSSRPLKVLNWRPPFGRETCVLHKTNKATLHTNDIVRYSGEVWRVLTTINGRKADLQRLHSTDPRIVTILTDNLEVIKRFGSPNDGF